jgi:predicted CXXCH cytochrome family protein
VTGLAWMLLAAAPVLADNGPHTAADNSGVNGIATDTCAGCHRAHTAKGANLLAEASETALCYTCHGRTGTGATTNVQDGQQYEALDGSIPGPVAGVVRGTAVAGALRGSWATRSGRSWIPSRPRPGTTSARLRPPGAEATSARAPWPETRSH